MWEARTLLVERLCRFKSCPWRLKNGVVEIIKRKHSYYLSLFLVIVFLAACSQGSNLEESQYNEITGQAIAAEILRACKYPDETFCSEKCCISEDTCNGEDAYTECNLNTGEWVNVLYQDAECLSKCELEIKKISDVKTDSTKCLSGWRCMDLFHLGYQLLNCSWISIQDCKYRCENSTCKSAEICKPGSLKCQYDTIRICNEEGSYWVYHQSCDFGCADGSCLTSSDINETQNTTEQPVQNTTQPPQNNDYLADRCINIANFNYDAAGSDSSSNLNDEYFTLKNTCSYSIDMVSWTVKDAANHAFTFPTFILSNSAEVTIHTGSGTADSTNLYWGRGSHVWNYGGDTLYLNTSNGTSVLIYSYP